MSHPRDGRVSRRRLLQGAAGLALGTGAAGALSGCANTTTPIGACESGNATGAVSELVEAKPTGPAGLPLPRPDNSVTWAITADNQPAPDGRKTEGGTLHVYNY